MINFTKDDNIREFNKYISDNKKHVQLIGRYYLHKVKLKQLKPFPSLKALKSDFGRQLRAASELAEYPEERIIKAVALASERTGEWTLLTVCKYINKN